ncbi:MAG TPA: CHAD domain-containing protein [Rhodoferax sp.]
MTSSIPRRSSQEIELKLAEGCLDKPLRAQPPSLTPKLSLHEATRQVLREMFCQFTTNLGLLCSSDNPEVVHQARVGWRRFRSALRLFKVSLPGNAMPSWQALQPLLNRLGEVRNFDVACTETLPPLAAAYADGNGQRAQAWLAMQKRVAQAAAGQRGLARQALQRPAVGACLLDITKWLEDFSASKIAGDAVHEPKEPLRDWARQRIKRLHAQLKFALQGTSARQPAPHPHHCQANALRHRSIAAAATQEEVATLA